MFLKNCTFFNLWPIQLDKTKEPIRNFLEPDVRKIKQSIYVIEFNKSSKVSIFQKILVWGNDVNVKLSSVLLKSYALPLKFLMIL